MWASGSSRLQYTFLGDVITFDTTYKINLYDMPFGLFLGVNNHFQSTILAGVLVCDETAKSFEWVFTEFLRMMGDDPPVTILIEPSHGASDQEQNVGHHAQVVQVEHPKNGKGVLGCFVHQEK
ncbi:hypothetical protein VPH35_043813 [Triticum aestivum]